MKNLDKKIIRKKLKKGLKIFDSLNNYIKPFKQMPSTNTEVNPNENRISANDLFSLYTADVIKQDIDYSR